jgi:asparagine synthetase B (glutamine-hydrolysing)
MYKGNLPQKEVFKLIEDHGFEKAIKLIKGSYAIVYESNGKIFAARDLLGLIPLFYDEKGFYFKKKGKELDPKKILIKEKGKISFKTRKFYSCKPEIELSEKKIVNELTKRIEDSVKKFDQKGNGVMFSGGIDSTLIAFLLKKYKVDFTCYVAGFVQEGYKEPDDIVFAKKIAKKYGFKIKVITKNLVEVEETLKKLIKIIGERDVVKLSVGLPIYFACEAAKENNNIYSGLGSEELFAGYLRHKSSSNVNLECIKGLKLMYERDNYRDYSIAKNFNLEVKVPFLDEELVKFALRIPSEFKIDDGIEKAILRKAAMKFGLDKEFSLRPKKAAQYGSRFMNAIDILKRKNKFKTKKEYINSL